ncbi:DUF2946 domain-containing protein [Phenylobacterium sp. LjRoot219]|uniref:DUF2946 family protein n=1 Tax=Phenylobacterium sp. LjRoot219 TaxID=3342283 RepID=UPI003ED10C48
MELGTARTGGHRRRAGVAAWLGVLALLIQALLPAAALAAQSRATGQQVVICTLQGVRTVTVGAHQTGGKGFAGLPCENCLAAATAAIPLPDPVAEPTVYATTRIEHAPERAWAPQLARAPPRPPGQGPPQT